MKMMTENLVIILGQQQDSTGIKSPDKDFPAAQEGTSTSSDYQILWQGQGAIFG